MEVDPSIVNGFRSLKRISSASGVQGLMGLGLGRCVCPSKLAWLLSKMGG